MLMKDYVFLQSFVIGSYLAFMMKLVPLCSPRLPVICLLEDCVRRQTVMWPCMLLVKDGGQTKASQIYRVSCINATEHL